MFGRRFFIVVELENHQPPSWRTLPVWGTLGPWGQYLTVLSHSFLVCKMGIQLSSSLRGILNKPMCVRPFVLQCTNWCVAELPMVLPGPFSVARNHWVPGRGWKGLFSLRPIEVQAVTRCLL